MKVRIANRRDGGWWWRLPVLAVIWLAIAAPIVGFLVVATTLRRWARDLPEVPDLAVWRAEAPQTTLVLAADGSHLAELPFHDGPAIGHRTLVAIDDVPREVVLAVLAAEDVRFFSHHGVDYQAIARAAWINYKSGRIVEGASTITQQVARNLLPAEIGTARTTRRKVREALLARAIEHKWSKRDVLETYLDFVFLGEGAYGMAAGAHAYFDRELSQLDLPQAALLAGLIQAPGRLDPFHHLEAARARRDEILARMARAGLITDAARATAAATAIELHRARRSYGTRTPWYTEYVRELVAREKPEELARGGLTIETAALPALGTALAHDARAHAVKWRHGDTLPQLGALVWDHHTGYIEAIVGGLVWGHGGDKFDRVTQACRQPGSAWKPIVYGAALEAGAITPGTALRDAPVSEYDEATNTHWKPHSSGKFRGIVLAADAFAASLNAPAIDVFDRVGAAPIIALARRLGITTALTDLRPMALGASCVKPIELAGAFATLARGGWAIAPRFVTRMRRGDAQIVDRAVPEDPWIDPARRYDRFAALAGSELDERIGADGGQRLDEGTAFQLVDMMSAVVERGTAAAAGATLGRPAAGKTGTTNDNTDAWFIGFTGRTLAAVWIGFDDPRLKLGSEGDGAHAALPLWLTAIRAAEADRPRVQVLGPPPPELERATIDRETGLLAAPHTGGLDLWFRKGTAPTEVSGQPSDVPNDFGRATREF